jgi:hypothetical protein
MRKICFAVFLAFALFDFLLAQKTVFHLQNPTNSFTAKVEQLKDSSILVSSGQTSSLEQFDIPVTRINEIHWRKKGKTGRGIGTGAAIGFGLGFIFGVATAHDEPDSFIYISPVEYGLGFGIVGGLVGGVVGGIVSAFDTKFFIGGSQTKYEQQKEKLQQLTGRR